MTSRALTLACLFTAAAFAAHADRSAPRKRKAPTPPPAAEPAPAEAVTPAAPAAPPRATPPERPAVTPAPMPVMPGHEGHDHGPTPTPAAAPQGPGGTAVIEELVFDAGDIERGKDIVHAFTIKNTGEHDLTVDARPGCGCTVTEYDKLIAPGGTGKINATVHTTNFKGPVAKSITVTTNDQANPRFTLQVKANVLVPLDFQPSENLAFNGKADQLKAQEITVSATDGSIFDVTEAKSADGKFDVRVEPVVAEGETAPKAKAGTVASGSSKYKVVVTPGKDVAIGRLNSSVVLKTTHPKAPEQTLRVFGTITGEVEVVPQYVSLSTGASAAPEAKVQHVAIKKLTGTPLEVLSATSDNPSIVTSVKPVTAGREYDLEVKYTGEPTTTPLTAKIAIQTNDPKQPSLEVQVWGRNDPEMRPMASGGPVTIKPLPAPVPPTP